MLALATANNTKRLHDDSASYIDAAFSDEVLEASKEKDRLALTLIWALKFGRTGALEDMGPLKGLLLEFGIDIRSDPGDHLSEALRVRETMYRDPGSGSHRNTSGIFMSLPGIDDIEAAKPLGVPALDSSGNNKEHYRRHSRQARCTKTGRNVGGF